MTEIINFFNVCTSGSVNLSVGKTEGMGKR